MIQTSKRAQTRRIARTRSRAVAKPILNQTHPLGNRLLRRKFEANIRKSIRKVVDTKGAFGKVGSLMG